MGFWARLEQPISHVLNPLNRGKWGRSLPLSALLAAGAASALAPEARADFFCQNGQLYTLKSNPPGQNLRVPCNASATLQLHRNTLNSWQKLYSTGAPVQTALGILSSIGLPPGPPPPAPDDDDFGGGGGGNDDEPEDNVAVPERDNKEDKEDKPEKKKTIEEIIVSANEALEALNETFGPTPDEVNDLTDPGKKAFVSLLGTVSSGLDTLQKLIQTNVQLQRHLELVEQDIVFENIMRRISAAADFDDIKMFNRLMKELGKIKEKADANLRKLSGVFVRLREIGLKDSQNRVASISALESLIERARAKGDKLSAEDRRNLDKLLESILCLKKLLLENLQQANEILPVLIQRDAEAQLSGVQNLKNFTFDGKTAADLQKLIKEKSSEIGDLTLKIRQTEKQIATAETDLLRQDLEQAKAIFELRRKDAQVAINNAEKTIKLILSHLVESEPKDRDPEQFSFPLSLQSIKTMIETTRASIERAEEQIKLIEKERERLKEVEEKIKRKNGFALTATHGFGAGSPGSQPSGVSIWSSASFNHVSDTQGLRNSRTASGSISTGFGFALSDTLAIGLGLGYAPSRNTERGFMRTESHGFSLTPNVVWRPGGPIFFDASLGLFFSQNKTDRGGITGKFDTTGVAFNVGVNGKIDLGQAVSLSTRIGYAHMFSWSEAYRESDGTAVAKSNEESGRITASLNLSRSFDGGSVFLSAATDVPALRNQLPLETVREAQLGLSAGASWSLDRGANLSVSLSGLNTVSGLSSYGGSLSFSVPLN